MRRQPAAVGRELLDDRGVFGSDLEQVLFETVEVCVDVDGGPGGELHAHELVVVDQFQPLDETDLLPQLVEAGARPRAGEPVDAAIEGVAFALPGGAEAPGL